MSERRSGRGDGIERHDERAWELADTTQPQTRTRRMELPVLFEGAVAEVQNR
jgi:hypothetical protein